MAANNNLPWLIMGGLIDLLSNQGFHHALLDCELYDLPMNGYQYTWAKRKGEYDVIKEILDRGLTTIDWIELFPDCKITNGLASKSYHTPIIIQLHGDNMRKFKRRFKFENLWLIEPELENIVELV